MTTNEPTAQETQIYQALGDGDHDTITQLQADAAAAGPDELDQYNVDYANAWGRYQADHEPPQAQRVQNTAEQVTDENQAAG